MGFAAYLMEEVIDNFGVVSTDSESPLFIGAKECANNTAELSAVIEFFLCFFEYAPVQSSVIISYDSKYAVAIVNDMDEHFEVKGYNLTSYECSWVSKFKGVYIKMALIEQTIDG